MFSASTMAEGMAEGGREKRAVGMSVARHGAGAVGIKEMEMEPRWRPNGGRLSSSLYLLHGL